MMQYALPLLGDDPEAPFPDPLDCDHPDGLVAIGGDLSRPRLLGAYRHGIFPWYEPGGPILWWSPDPRAVLIPGHLHVSRRLARTLARKNFEISVNRAFDAVIDGCAAPRREASGTWITAEMRAAYVDLHHSGHAHSLEVWQHGKLAGGLYGVIVGKMFFAESKFHVQRDASKIALVELMQRLLERGFLLCDCQLWNPHLEHFGVRMMDRPDFVRVLRHAANLPAGRLD
ncbi:MAG: leucyl/phenylalanyl-tRNA--protein transferase [Wenzhouxiangellaceae bacterium]|nr:leucyl/phenylalanyl-tRNA--protein transferase [Wenzhouxiangellaceae bacterium]